MLALLSSLMSFIGLIIKVCLSPITWLIRFIFHRIFGLSWQAPDWFDGMNDKRRASPKTFWSLTFVSILSITGLLFAGFYQLFVPVAPKVQAHIYTPEISTIEETIKPEPLIIRFDYQRQNSEEKNLFTRPIKRPTGRLSVAPISQIDQVITSGIKMFPNRAGTWRWISDNRIEFTPKNDWPAAQEYTIQFDKSAFAAHIEMAKFEYQFTTQNFNGSIDELRLYKDPTQSNAHYLMATLSFSHPVETDQIRQHLYFEVQNNQVPVALTRRPDVEIRYANHNRTVYLKSKVDLPNQDQYAYLHLETTLTTKGTTTALENSLKEKVLIPSVSSFFRVSESNIDIVRNQDNQPEQIVNLQFTDNLTRAALEQKLEIKPLPKMVRRWTLDRARAAREQLESVEFEWLANEHKLANIYNLKLDVPERQALYIRINAGLSSGGDYRLSKPYEKVIYVDDYPKEVSIMGEGSLLSLSGDKTLSLMSRGHTALKVSIHKLQENQLNHLISQTRGDISNPYFKNYQFNQDNITVEYEQILRLSQRHPKELNYASVSLASYLKEAGMGVFFVKTTGWDMNRNRSVHGSEDKRLIVITDLGVLIKKTNDFNRQHVFVQSIKQGTAIANAKVDVLGKNGISIFSGETDANGHLEIHDLSRLYREQQPTVFLIKKGNDRTFLPYNQHSRQINYSRFDISGKNTGRYGNNEMSAYVFTDRGIYRPGETVKFANIVKDNQFKSTSGLPLQFTITDPRGKQVLNKKLKLNQEGLFDLSFQTELTHGTGSYQANLYLLNEHGYLNYRLGGVQFSVEEFQPDTLKISSTLTPVFKQGWFNRDTMTAKINLKNLFGTPAQDRKITGNLRLTPTHFAFKQYPGYRFTDPLRDENARLREVNERLTDQTTNADGEALFQLAFDQYQQGTYRLTFETEGFEAGGGRSVYTQNQALISPLPHLVGYKADGALDYLKKEQVRTIELTAINPELMAIDLKDLSLQLIHKQPVSTLVMADDGSYSYQSVIKHKTINNTSLIINADNENKISLNTDNAGDYQLIVLDQNKHPLTKIDYSVVAAGNIAGQLEQNAELSLKLNKQDYTPGEWIELNIVAPYSGSGLITIESDTVHAHKWFKTTTNSAVQKIQLPKDLEGNAYINVAFIRAQNANEIFTSPLSYAVKSFNIDRSSRQVDINLETPSIVRPGQAMNIGYSTDKPAKIIVFAVDQGILQVANYQMPKPLDHFLSKKALEVRTFQMLDLILPEYKVLLKHAGVGGGASAMKLMSANINPFQRTRDIPAVFWSGVLDANEQKQHTEFVVPDTFSGNLKVMAVAVSEQAIGATSNDSIVRGPFVLSPNLLTTATPGDEFDVTLAVANIIEGSGDNAKVEISISATSNLDVIDSKKTELTISEGSEDSVTFRVRVKEQLSSDLLGEGSLTFEARHTSDNTVEIGRRSASLSIRPATHYQTTIETGFTKDNLTLTTDRTLYSSFASKTIMASASPMVLTQGFMTFLANYTHGCTEQVSSQVFPWINLTSQPEFLDQRVETEKRLTDLIQILRNRQQTDGGFGMWSGSYSSANFATLYATHLLSEAKSHNFYVPNDVLNNALEHVRNFAREPHSNLEEARLRAFAIYLLVLNEEVATSYLIDLHDSLKTSDDRWQTDITSSYLAASYQLLKSTNKAKTLISMFDPERAPQAKTDYQTKETQFSQYVYLVANHFPEQFEQLNPEITLTRLMDASKEQRLTTINAAYATLAINAFSTRNRARHGEDNVSFQWKSEENTQGTDISPQRDPFPNAELPLSAQSVTIDSRHPIFYQSIQSGFDQPSLNASAANSSSPAKTQGIEVLKTFHDLDGNPVSTIKQGEELLVKLKVRTTDASYLSNVAIIDLQPAGFEIKRSSVPRETNHWRSDYIDIREDRLIIYGGFDQKITEISYQVKATASGQFISPAVFAEAMYDPTTFGLSDSHTITVQASN